MKSRVSEKGQVTIPKKIRDALGLDAGTLLEFAVEGSKLTGTKKLSEDPFHKWRGRGRLPAGRNVDEYLAAIRGDS